MQAGAIAFFRSASFGSVQRHVQPDLAADGLIVHAGGGYGPQDKGAMGLKIVASRAEHRGGFYRTVCLTTLAERSE